MLRAITAENAEERSDAIHHLVAFENATEAQRGVHITDAQADDLIQRSVEIRAVLEAEG